MVYEMMSAYGSEGKLGQLALVLVKVIGHQFEPGHNGQEIRTINKPGHFQGVFLNGAEPCWIIASDHGPIQRYSSRRIGSCSGGLIQLRHHTFLVQEEEGGEIWEAEIGEEVCVDGKVACALVKTGRSFNQLVYDHSMGTVVGASYLETMFANFNEEGNSMWEPDGQFFSCVLFMFFFS